MRSPVCTPAAQVCCHCMATAAWSHTRAQDGGDRMVGTTESPLPPFGPHASSHSFHSPGSQGVLERTVNKRTDVFTSVAIAPRNTVRVVRAVPARIEQLPPRKTRGRAQVAAAGSTGAEGRRARPAGGQPCREMAQNRSPGSETATPRPPAGPAPPPLLWKPRAGSARGHPPRETPEKKPGLSAAASTGSRTNPAQQRTNLNTNNTSSTSNTNPLAKFPADTPPPTLSRTEPITANNTASGNTALHDCAESGSLEIMKMLLKYCAKMEKDGYGMTPLLSASVTGHTNIVDFLTQHEQTSKIECINALELLGATFVDKKRDLLGALKYWKRAMEMRYNDRISILNRPVPQTLIMAYDYAKEVNSLEELENLIADPDEMRMQALLIRERILGPSHPDTSYYIRYRGAVYADSGNFKRCINLWKYALDMQQSNLDPLSPMTASSLLSFAELFSFMLQDKAKGLLGTTVTFDDLMGILCKSVLEIERAMKQIQCPPDPIQLNKALSIILHLICLLEKVPCTSEQEHFKKQTIYKFLKLQPRGKNNFSPLHLAVDKNTTYVGRYPICKFPSLQVTAILVECGANINVRDSDNNSPLHIAALNNHPGIMNFLIKSGSHFDATNLHKQTASDLLDEKKIAKNLIHPINHTTLQCLAARVIVNHNICYAGHIPEKLEKFVLFHR
ncbi:protein fem-1 homolog C-like [Pyrgilauda ruficollis]|uniref:protein fem-1 homolog C-like n=1 Tax=Pyrgilauda ruficollis TaxID=221976 RepID=UPI001B884563|nr:protein fem-1 homolog C-like [Pyrgilauda ruficollis]